MPVRMSIVFIITKKTLDNITIKLLYFITHSSDSLLNKSILFIWEIKS
jgi:hypothetical protein